MSNPELIEVLKNLTVSINANNELLKNSIKQNDISVAMLNDINMRLDILDECCNDLKDDLDEYHRPEYGISNNTEPAGLKYIADYDSNKRLLASFDIANLVDTIFTVSCGDKTLCLDLHNLAIEATKDASDEYLNVTSFKTNALN